MLNYFVDSTVVLFGVDTGLQPETLIFLAICLFVVVGGFMLFKECYDNN